MQGSQSQFNQVMHTSNFQPLNPFQQSGGGAEKTGVNAGPFNMQANFANIQGCEEFQPRGTTRVIYSDGRCATFTCTNENFPTIPSYTIQGTTVALTNGNCVTYKQQQNFQQNKTFIHQQNPGFRNDYCAQQNYGNRPQCQSQRFNGMQGSKMRSQHPFRNFGTQNQNRRFKPKNFNNKMQKAMGFCQIDNNQKQTESQDFQQQHRYHQVQNGPVPVTHSNNDPCRMDSENSDSGRQVKYKDKNNSSPIHFRPKESQIVFSKKGNKNKGGKNKNVKLLKPKVEVDYSSSPRFSASPPHNISYDDISENSDENEDFGSDHREEPFCKKQEPKIVVKREPGEIDSEDESMPWSEDTSKKTAAKPDQEKNQRKAEAEGNRKKNAPTKSESRKRKKPKKERSSSLDSPSRNSRSSYSCHDDRFVARQDGSGGRESDNRGQTREGCSSFCRSTSYDNAGHESSKSYYYPEVEVTDLKEKISEMKQSLRECRDQLLEAKVIASKKTLRLESEIDQLKNSLACKEKVEGELSLSLKKAENELTEKEAELAEKEAELVEKAAELASVTVLYEAEKQEKAKFQADLSRTYQDRLIIESDKLRALFDVEVAKMQAYYLSHNLGYGETCYYRDTMPFNASANQVNDDDIQHSGPSSSASSRADTSAENFPQTFYNQPSDNYFDSIQVRVPNTFESECQGQHHFSNSPSYFGSVVDSTAGSGTNTNIFCDTDNRIGSAFTLFGTSLTTTSNNGDLSEGASSTSSLDEP